MDLYFIRDKKGKKGKGKKEKEPSSPNVVTSPNEIDKEFDIVVPEQVHTINKFALVHVLSLSLPPPSLSLSLFLSLFLSLSLSFPLSFSIQNGTTSKGGSKEEDEEWSVDTSEEAVRKRMEKLSEGVTAMTLNEDLEKSNTERVNMFYKHVEVRISCWLCSW